ncbi:MAG: GHKL domain-containing protein [Defluviitaleaceae bacterium]|nr:GHKL domain-containing protein [Defluviitaleaceae bacterium]
MDNALDAVSKASEKIIKLDVEFGKGGLFVKVENSFNGEIIYATDTAEDRKRIASTKNSEEHGYGLRNIQQSIEKYDGYMNTSHTENIFSSIVFLYVDDAVLAV